jgi:beta-glucosidase
MGLFLDEKAAIVCGAGFWETVALPGHGIRSIVLSDGPHGLRTQAEGGDHLGLGTSIPATCFPPAAGIASSWNPALIERVGVALGEECRAEGVSVLLGPGINIKRSPLCGRNFEYYSEDPLLSGRLGAAWVRGIQSTGVGASLKHFAVNNQETNRMTVSAEVDEQTLRELYLPAFEHVVTTEQPWTVMCSYNRINGVFAAESSWLLTDVLREEWGFAGAVVSDWGAVDDSVAAVAAGTDLEMPGPQPGNARAIVAAVASGALALSSLDAAVERVVALAARGNAPVVPYDVEAHHSLAREAAVESIVLLRNEGVLPLARTARVAVFGDLTRIQGAGSSQVSPTRVDAFLPGVARSVDPADAAAADVAIVLVGLPDAAESEGFDRTHLDLPAADLSLIAAVTAVQPHTVVVLTNGGVVSLEPWHDSAAAIVEAWLLGQGGGSALESVLFGEANPSGKLAETIPLRLQDTPAYLNFPGDGDVVRYGEGVFVGYRYYEAVEAAVRYPFGWGLSYSAFTFDDFVATSSEATVRVTNTGLVAGAEVVQVYLVGRPKTLVGFEKVTLSPGESRVVTVSLAARSFARWDVRTHSWEVAGGEYELQLGRNARDVEAVASVVLPASRPLAPLSLGSTVADLLGHPVSGPLLRRASRGAVEGGAGVLDMVASMPVRRLLRFPGVPVSERQVRVIFAVANNRVVRGFAGLLRRG